MLVFQTVRMLLRTGERIPMWNVRVEISQTGGSPVALEEFLIDTGATYTVVPMDLAHDIGLSDRWIRDNCAGVTLTVADGKPLTGYLHDVRLRVDDDYQGFAYWNAPVVFSESVRKPHAGRSGFLHYLRFADEGNQFTFDPVGVPTGQYRCSRQGSP